jgi:hypothetical protein
MAQHSVRGKYAELPEFQDDGSIQVIPGVRGAA